MSYVPTSKVRENVEVPTPVFLAYSGTAAAESKVIEYKPCCSTMVSVSTFQPSLNQEFLCTGGPRLTRFLGLGKIVLHETRVSGTVLWSPTNANSPTYTYISQKTC